MQGQSKQMQREIFCAYAMEIAFKEIAYKIDKTGAIYRESINNCMRSRLAPLRIQIEITTSKDPLSMSSMPSLIKQSTNNQQIVISDSEEESQRCVPPNAEPKSQYKKESIQLGELSLNAIVTLCYQRGLVPAQLYFQYLFTEGIYIQICKGQLSRGQFNQSTFKNARIALTDHRRLASALLRLFPEEFVRSTIKQNDAQIDRFLLDLYSMSEEDYCCVIARADLAYGNSWWSDIIHNQKQL